MSSTGSLRTNDVILHVDKRSSGTIRAELDGGVIEEDLARGLPTGAPDVYR